MEQCWEVFAAPRRAPPAHSLEGVRCLALPRQLVLRSAPRVR